MKKQTKYKLNIWICEFSKIAEYIVNIKNQL